MLPVKSVLLRKVCFHMKKSQVGLGGCVYILDVALSGRKLVGFLQARIFLLSILPLTFLDRALLCSFCFVLFCFYVV